VEKKYEILFKKRDGAMLATIVEFVVFAFALLVFVGLVITNIRTRMQNNRLKANLAQESIDRAIVMQEMQKLMAEIDTKNSSQNDGFLKFVSESRSAAFQYIEEVQAAISEFDSRLGPVVRHYKETGKILHTKPSELVKELSSAYDKLMDSMPKEEKGSD
jgi:mannitol-specific phosphotransferase system IIBC component